MRCVTVRSRRSKQERARVGTLSRVDAVKYQWLCNSVCVLLAHLVVVVPRPVAFISFLRNSSRLASPPIVSTSTRSARWADMS